MSLIARAARRLVLATRDDDGAPAGVLPPPRRPATTTTTVTSPAQALALDSVYRCVSVIQTAAKQLSLDVWRRDTATGESVLLDEADVPAILTRPAPDTDQTDLIAETIASLALRGNAYWLVTSDRDGRATGIRVLDPLDCTPTINRWTGERTVRWHGRTWKPEQLRHLRLLRVPGDPEGLGPIQACARALGGATQMSEYVSQWITDSGVPTGVLSTDQTITAEQAQEAKTRWNESNSPGQGVAVLGNGLSYAPLSLKPSEVQFLETRAFDVLAVGRMFGVPAHMLLAAVPGTSMTYQNVGDAALDFIRWTVMAYLREIEAALTKVMPRTTTVRFNLDALLRADASTRMSTHATAITAGVYDPAWARRIEGIPTTATKETDA